MQLGALIKTRRRKWAMIALGVVVCAAAVWVLLDAGHKPTDEEKFRKMVRSQNWWFRFAGVRHDHKLPGPLDRLLSKFEGRSEERSENLVKELHASGYLVNLPVTPGYSNQFKFFDKLGTNFYWTYTDSGDSAYISCCSNDAARIRALIEKKP